MPLSVLIADDHALFRSGLKQLLSDELSASIVREAATFDAAVDILTAEAHDLVLVDLNMPGMSGAETLAALRDGFPDAKVAVVSATEERSEILAALAAGVHGFVPKSLPSNEIAAALKAVSEGRIFVPAAIGRRGAASTSARLAPPMTLESLTTRQRDVLGELMKGKASKEIARALDIAEGTVKIHLAAIYRTLGVRTRAEAIAKLSGN
jgi:DNA-binding NarL/FixJ family response regulator